MRINHMIASILLSCASIGAMAQSLVVPNITARLEFSEELEKPSRFFFYSSAPLAKVKLSNAAGEAKVFSYSYSDSTVQAYGTGEGFTFTEGTGFDISGKTKDGVNFVYSGIVKLVDNKAAVATKLVSASQDAPAGNYNELKVLQLVNDYRAQSGRHPLQLSPSLSAGCYGHASHMASRRSMFHANGYRENVAMGQGSPESVVNDWINSSGHRANILSASTYMGVGNHGVFWCQRFQ